MNRFDEFLVGVRDSIDLDLSRKARRKHRKVARSKRCSANLVVDINGTCQSYPSIQVAAGGIGTLSGQIGIVSGYAMPASGGIVGASVNMLHADTFTNVLVAGIPAISPTSGQLRVAVQSSDTDTSGTYTDPTSGLQTLPTWFSSGGILIINSGGLLGSTQGQIAVGPTSGQPLSGYCVQSGFQLFAAFQRPGTFCRAVVLSGDFYVGTVEVGFVGQYRTTGSGGGFSMSPTSGGVNV